jgi:hypothetical protein
VFGAGFRLAVDGLLRVGEGGGLSELVRVSFARLFGRRRLGVVVSRAFAAFLLGAEGAEALANGSDVSPEPDAEVIGVAGAVGVELTWEIYSCSTRLRWISNSAARGYGEGLRRFPRAYVGG